MKKILMLSTRYPFPVRKGDQVVINNRLLILQKKYHIDLVTFVKNSKQYTKEEKQFKNVTFHKIKFSYLVAIKKILINLFKREPFQIEIYNQKNYINYVNSLLSKNNYSKVLGKAGASRWRNKRPTVRGVAMNPIDHPHGGGEGKKSGHRQLVTPWGRLTKGVKTRSKQKKNNKSLLYN